MTTTDLLLMLNATKINVVYGSGRGPGFEGKGWSYGNLGGGGHSDGDECGEGAHCGSLGGGYGFYQVPEHLTEEPLP